MKDTDIIYVIVYSLKYEADPTRYQRIERKQFYNLRRAKRNPNELITRASLTRWKEEARQTEREEYSKQYDRAIQKKYNVGPDYKNNRWFMEQVRPTL